MKKILFLLLAIGLSLDCNCQQIVKSFRPSSHYTPKKNWVNDPNGLIYLAGEYHLFYQYNPFGNQWGHMSWGHAISKDLKKWVELPVAIPEIKNQDGTTTMIFSGSVVVDSSNSSGLFNPGFKAGMIAVFTSHLDNNGVGIKQHQSLAYSKDLGRTWKFYDRNPVLDLGLKDFRDPFVFWYPERSVWLMTVVKPLEFTIQIYESKNLINWKLISEFIDQRDQSRIWECPSLVKVPVAGETKDKWVLSISAGSKSNNLLGVQYYVGDFDGFRFKSQNQEQLFFDSGSDNYASVPFNNLPKINKKPIFMSWVSDWEYARVTPTTAYRGQFSLPREVELYKVKEGLFKIKQTPIVTNSISTFNQSLKHGDLLSDKIKNSNKNSYRLVIEFDLKNSKGFDLELLKFGNEKITISYNVSTNKLLLDRRNSGIVNFSSKFPVVSDLNLLPENDKIKLDIIVDNSIIEVFANDGKEVLTSLVFPSSNQTKINLNWK